MKKFLSAMASALSQVLTSGAELAGIAGAKYHEYWLDANQKRTEESKKQQMINEQNAHWCRYQLYAELLMNAINNTADVTNLQKVSDFSQLYVSRWLGCNSNHLRYYIYRGRSLNYSNTIVRKIHRVLQAEIDRLCNLTNMPLVKICITLKTDQVVIIQIALVSELMANFQHNK